MAYSTQSAVSDGTLSTLPLSLDYLSRDDISVYFGTIRSTPVVDWQWVGTTDKIIKLTKPAPFGTVVTVKRATKVDTLYHKFSGGAQFTAQTLDESLQQTLLVAQEFSESAGVPSDDMPLPVGSQASPGFSSKFARADHVHVGMTGGSVGSVAFDTFTGDGAKTSFALANTPVSKGTTQVFVDSVYQPKAAYLLIGNSIAFDEAPANGSVVEVVTLTIGGGRASDVLLTETAYMLSSTTGGNTQGALASLFQTISNLASATGALLVGYSSGISNTVTRTLKARLTDSLSFRDFGAKGDGTTDDTAALQAALTYAAGKPGVCITSSPGDVHKITAGLVVPYDNKNQDPTSAVNVDFTGTSILPAADNIVCLTVARDFTTIRGASVINSASRTGITAYAISPVAGNTAHASQQFSKLVDPVSYNVDVGIKLMPGPTISGAASGAFYNTIINPVARGVKCAIWLAGNSSALDVLNTRTTIINPIHVGGNCSFFGEACDSTNVVGGASENITIGTWPCSTPTTIYIPQKFPSHTLDNNSFRFNGFTAETGVIPYNIAAYYCSLVNVSFIGYTQPSVGDHNRVSWVNKGAVYSESERAGKLAMIAVKTTGGKQAYLSLDGGGATKAELYSDTGFKLSSAMDAQDLRTASASGQYLGGNGMSVALGGSGQNVQFYNLSNAGTGGFEYGGCTYVRSDTDNSCTLGTSARRFSTIYAGTAAINTSDERMKEQIEPIPEAVMRAWAKVKFVQYKFKDSVAEKGSAARLHFGVIAQRIKEAFESEGLDPFAYGILCYDQWGDIPGQVLRDPEGNVLAETPAQPAGDRYGVRYEEALVLTCAYLLWVNKKD